jgi:hypothetical protein
MVKRLLVSILISAAALFAAPADTADAELAQFKTFIQEHPRALDDLKKDPSLIGNPDFAKEHKVVGEYLAAHRTVIAKVKAVPHFFDNLSATTKGGDHREHPDGDGRGGQK